MTRIVFHNVPSINDHKIFPSTTIKGEGNNPSTDFKTSNVFKVPEPEKWILGKDVEEANLETFLRESNTVAFIILRNDTILFEKYTEGYSREKEIMAFSATKILIASLLEIAIREGRIKGLDQKVSDFIPAFKKTNGDSLRLIHLRDMTSGINHSEYGNLFQTLVTYYHPNLDKRMKNVKFETSPGQKFVYKSIDYQILGRCIEIGTGMSIEEYLKIKIWDKINAKTLIATKDSKNGNERMFGGMALLPIDLIKFGTVFVNEGFYENKRIVSDEWVKNVLHRDNSKPWWAYRSGWWRDSYLHESFEKDTDFFASGFGGQCMLVNPKHKTVILRLGKNKGGVIWHTSLSKLAYLINDAELSPSLLNKDISGKYLSSLDSERTLEVVVKKAGEKWLLKEFYKGKLHRKIKLTAYCDKSLFNATQLIRIIFSENEEGRINGLFYDDGVTTVKNFNRIK